LEANIPGRIIVRAARERAHRNTRAQQFVNHDTPDPAGGASHEDRMHASALTPLGAGDKGLFFNSRQAYRAAYFRSPHDGLRANSLLLRRNDVHRLDAGEHPVHVHRVQQWLVVAGLELVGTDQEEVVVTDLD
jgi:hypothetical protein